MSARRRTGKGLRRSSGNRPEKRIIVVFSEGKNSEPDYVNGLKRLPHISDNVALNIDIHPEHGVPLTLVRLAVERRKDREVDECWCLFDVEWPMNHPNLRPALSLARDNGIRLAVSNPCFEIWLILHHQEISRFCDTGTAESKSRSLDGRSGKSIDASVYMPLRKGAARRAEQLDLRHRENGTEFPNDNPSSGMYMLLSSLERSERS
jgi:RloB-like protein